MSLRRRLCDPRPRAGSLLLFAAGFAVLAVACRDDVAPFEARDRDREVPAGSYRLTFSSGDDRAPAWSSGGDSVYYGAEGFGHLPLGPGVLVGLPYEGGATRQILRNVHVDNALGLVRWMVTPTPSPDGDRLAFVEIPPLWPTSPCPTAALSCDPESSAVPLPPLRQLILRVRRFDALGPLEDDPAHSVAVPGVAIDQVQIGLMVVPRYTVLYHRFQRLFEDERAFTFRPSWSPDGQRLVFSDGLGLWTWNVVQEEAVPIPGTGNGVWPAWSPDGEWIAFTRLEGIPSAHYLCRYLALGICAEIDYTVFDAGAHTLNLIRPDGTEARELGEGDEPAWTPDSQALFFRRGDQVWRIDSAGGEDVPVPDTRGGREPAVSPDGRRLAFSRRNPRGDYDIWIVQLQP